MESILFASRRRIINIPIGLLMVSGSVFGQKCSFHWKSTFSCNSSLFSEKCSIFIRKRIFSWIFSFFAHLAPGLVKPMRNQWFWGVPARKKWIWAKKSTFSPENRKFAEFSRFCGKWEKISLFSEKAPQEPCKYHMNYCRFRTRARKADISTQKLPFYEKSAFWWNFSEFLEKSWFLVPFSTFCAFPRPFARKAAIVKLFHRYFRWIIGQTCDLDPRISLFTENVEFQWKYNNVGRKCRKTRSGRARCSHSLRISNVFSA